MKTSLIDDLWRYLLARFLGHPRNQGPILVNFPNCSSYNFINHRILLLIFLMCLLIRDKFHYILILIGK